MPLFEFVVLFDCCNSLVDRLLCLLKAIFSWCGSELGLIEVSDDEDDEVDEEDEDDSGTELRFDNIHKAPLEISN